MTDKPIHSNTVTQQQEAKKERFPILLSLIISPDEHVLPLDQYLSDEITKRLEATNSYGTITTNYTRELGSPIIKATLMGKITPIDTGDAIGNGSKMLAILASGFVLSPVMPMSRNLKTSYELRVSWPNAIQKTYKAECKSSIYGTWERAQEEIKKAAIEQADACLTSLANQMTAEAAIQTKGIKYEAYTKQAEPITNVGDNIGRIDSDTTDRANSEKSSIVSLIKTGGVYEIPVMLNDVLKINVIIDSGAADVSIAPEVALTLIRTGTIKETDWLPGQMYSFANGSTATSARFKLHSIKMGNQIINDIPTSIANSVRAPMLLGQSALQRFGKYTIDYKKGTIEFN